MLPSSRCRRSTQIERPIHERIRDQLRAAPDRIVAEDRAGPVSAADFDDRVERCRDMAPDAGGGESVTASGSGCVRSVDVLVAVHAVLRSGAAFVMLDPADPEARHAAIAADAELRTIVDDLTAADGVTDVEPNPISVGLDDIAYVLYTSGSTGLPKGVPISHRGLVDYIDVAIDAYCRDVEPPIVALHSALVFDLTITSLFLSFVTGGKVVVFDGEPVVALARIAADDRVTFIKATPSQLEIFARMVETPRPIRTVVVGGEAFRRPVAVATALACRPDVRIFNEYGPTEAVVGCMIHEWDPAADTGTGRADRSRRAGMRSRAARPLRPPDGHRVRGASSFVRRVRDGDRVPQSARADRRAVRPAHRHARSTRRGRAGSRGTAPVTGCGSSDPASPCTAVASTTR